MKTNYLHLIFSIFFALSIVELSHAQKAKTIKPSKKGFSKSTEQNQPTGSPDYVVDQQSNKAQSTISTPVKKKNKKKLFAKKAKETNQGSTNAVPSPPAPNDAISYGISSPQEQKNDKEIRKQKSAQTSQTVGNEKLVNTNNIKQPRKEAKAGGNLKGGLPASQRAVKSTEQNQVTGTPDYIVTQQSNGAQTIISTPEKKQNTKKMRAVKSKEQNTGSEVGVGNTPSYNDDISYGITSPEKQVNLKDKLKQKSVKQNAAGDELLEKQYNIKEPKEESKKGGNLKGGIPVSQQKIKSIESSGFTGNDEPKSSGNPNEEINSLVIPVNPKSKRDVTKMTKYTGNDDPRSDGIANNSSTSLVIPMDPKSNNDVTIMTNYRGDLESKSTEQRDISSTAITSGSKPKMTKEELGKRTLEMTTGEGDVDLGIKIARDYVEELIGIESASYRGEIKYSKLAEIRDKRKAASKEMSSNTGDLAGAYQKMKDTEKKNAIKVREYKGTLNYDILAKQKAHEKDLDKEMGSNQGDIVGGYEKMKQTEKDKAIEVREYRGKLDYDILKNREDLRKQKSAEMAKNTGDIIGSYVDMRNRWKEKSEKIHDYSGKIDYDVLKNTKDKMKALNKEMYSNTGDILTVSLEKKRSTLREKSRKATTYEGDMIVTKRTRSNHPSAVYIEANDSKSIEAKEKLRKQLLKKSRKHRDKEDPKYMREEAPKPRYDEREYQIWESKTREGDAGFTKETKEKKQ